MTSTVLLVLVNWYCARASSKYPVTDMRTQPWLVGRLHRSGQVTLRPPWYAVTFWMRFSAAWTMRSTAGSSS